MWMPPKLYTELLQDPVLQVLINKYQAEHRCPDCDGKGCDSCYGVGYVEEKQTD